MLKNILHNKDRKNFSFFRFSLDFSIITGTFFRIQEFLRNRSLWYNEAALALNVINKSFFQLFTQPLDYTQASPFGFLMLAKIATFLFGANEFVFRLIPLISAFFSFLVLYKLASYCVSKWASVLTIYLFAISLELIRYATEFKQYSSDVLFFMLIILIGLQVLEKGLNLKRAVFLGFLGAVMLWFSFPVIFGLGGVGVVLFCNYISKKRWIELRNLLVSFLYWEISFIFLYFIFLKAVTNNGVLQNYWSNSFMPLPPFSISDQYWFSKKMIEVFYTPGAIYQPFLGAVLFFIGCGIVYKKNTVSFFLMISPLFFVLLASGMHQYPFSGRLLLFYVPFLYLFMSEGIIGLIQNRFIFVKIIGIILCIAVLYLPITASVYQYSVSQIYSEEIKPILEYVHEEIDEGDCLYVYYGADCAFNFYKKLYGFNKYIKGINSRDDWKKYYEDIDKLAGNRRVWVIFSHVYYVGRLSEENYIVDYLNIKGKLLDAGRFQGAAAYLFDLSIMK